MPIHVECDECGAKYRMDEQRAGQVVPCRRCGAEIDVPGRARPGARPAGRPAGPSPNRQRKRTRREPSGGVPVGLWIGGGAALAVILGVVLFVVLGSGGGDPSKEEVADAAPGGDTPPGTGTDPRPKPPVPETPEERLARHKAVSAWTSKFFRARSQHANEARSAAEGLRDALIDVQAAARRQKDQALAKRAFDESAAVFHDPNVLPTLPQVRADVDNYLRARKPIDEKYLNELKALRAGMPAGAVDRHALDAEFRATEIVLSRASALAPVLAGSAGSGAKPGTSGGPKSTLLPIDAPQPPQQWTVQPDPSPIPLDVPDDYRLELALADESTPAIDAPEAGNLIYPHGPTHFVAVAEPRPGKRRVIYDLLTGQPVAELQAPGTIAAGAFSVCTVSSDGRYFVESADQRTLAVYDRTQKKWLGAVAFPARGKPFVRSKGRSLIGVPEVPGQIFLWPLPTGRGRTITLLDRRDYQISSMTLSPGGGYFAADAPMTAAKEGHVLVFDLDKGELAGMLVPPVDGLREFGGKTLALAFSPDGKELAGLFRTGGVSGLDWLVAWEVASGKPVYRCRFDDDLGLWAERGLREWWEPLQWFPDRQGWLIGHRHVVDRQSGKVLWTFPEPSGKVLGDHHVILLHKTKDDVPALIAIPVGRSDAAP